MNERCEYIENVLVSAVHQIFTNFEKESYRAILDLSPWNENSEIKL